MPAYPITPTVIRSAAVVLPEGIRRLDIGMRHGKIERIAETLDGYETVIDASDCTVIPGMIDVHMHGAMRVDANTATAEEFDTLSSFLASEGVTGFLPTIVCAAEPKTLDAIRRISEACGNVGGADILGCHIEGPFLNPDYRGAIPRRYLQAGDAALVARFLAAAGSCKLRMTAAPEVQGVEALMHYIVSQGILVGLGHSGASYEQAMNCIHLGADSFVHVMNAMTPLDRHEPGILGAALESDAYAEFICDGLHLHPANVRLLLKAKGLDKLLAVSDSIMAAGLGDGVFTLGAGKVLVKDGDAKLPDGRTRAGSTLTLRKALLNFMNYTGLQIDKAILPMTRNPAKLLGLDKQKGRIAEGMDADLAVMDAHMNTVYTFVGQRLTYRRDAM
ncbi:MAG: N-acetylglucosamine-6-phosphate deacetylase [Clostridiales bacterium]|nr:N-acetylglucosamine-6-phosphate deacetylase [Clostridiales bacterium]